MKRRPYLRLLMFYTACTVLVAGGNTQAGTLGMHYFPQGWDCQFLNPGFLTDEGWTQLLNQQIKPDLNHIASLNVGVIRVMIWPENCGYKHHKGVSSSADFNEGMRGRLNAYVAEIGARGMKVILNLTPNSGLNKLDSDPSLPSYNEYKSQMASLAGQIYNGLSATNQDHVLYFDVYDEADVCEGKPLECPSPTRIWDYVSTILNVIPANKRGLSLLHVRDDFPAFKTHFPINPLRYLALNTVAEFGSDVVPNTFEEIGTVVNDPYILNANTTVLLGSFGVDKLYGNTTNNQNHKSQFEAEQAQLDYIQYNITEAEALALPYYIHWHFADASPGTALNHGWGLIYATNQTTPLVNTAKAALGWLGTRAGPAGNNYDFETGGQPDGGSTNGWWNDGTSGSQLILGGSPWGWDWWDTTSNKHYGRLYLASQSTPRSAWMATHGGNVSTKTRLFVNFYYRSTLQNIHAEVHEYNASNVLLRINHSPSFTSTTWEWSNFQSRIPGGWFVNLLPGTHSVVLVIAGQTSGNPEDNSQGYLDVDTVSMSAR